jgi:hypothetical protein
MGGLGRAMLAVVADPTPVLLVAPWSSGRTQELLRDKRVNYFDLTGNVRIELDQPALFIQTEGAVRDPSPVARGKARVQVRKLAGSSGCSLTSRRPTVCAGSLPRQSTPKCSKTSPAKRLLQRSPSRAARQQKCPGIGARA